MNWCINNIDSICTHSLGASPTLNFNVSRFLALLKLTSLLPTVITDNTEVGREVPGRPDKAAYILICFR